MRKSWEILNIRKELLEFFEENLVFLKKILRMFLEKTQAFFFEKLLKECFQKKGNSKRKKLLKC